MVTSNRDIVQATLLKRPTLYWQANSYSAEVVILVVIWVPVEEVALLLDPNAILWL